VTARSVSVDVDRSPDAMAAYQLAKTIHRDGGNPSGTFGLLAKVVADRSWERLRDVGGEPFGSFTAFVETPEPYGLGITRGDLGRLLALRHPREDIDPEWRDRAPELRRKVARLIGEDIAPAGQPGAHRSYSGTVGTLPERDTAAATVARLKRDDPVLAARVVSGEVTANAAAREKGWRKPRVVLARPETVAQRIRESFTPEQIAQLIALLLPDGLAP
jgi:hypothetical protein